MTFGVSLSNFGTLYGKIEISDEKNNVFKEFFLVLK